MRGYPGSGKSTIARELLGVVVGRDYLREQMFGKHVLDSDGEDAVTVAQQAQVRALLAAGRDVIVDDMNVNPRYLRDWAKVARDLGVRFHVYDVITDAETCVYRDYQRMLAGGRYVGADVIRRVAKSFPIAKWPTVTAKPKPTAKIKPYVPDPNRPPVILADIDGTLAHMVDRSPYDYSRVSEDTVDECIRALVNRAWSEGTRVIVCSGRDSSCRKATKKWLADNGVLYDLLLMRPEGATDEGGNKLPDWIVKLDLFNEYVRDYFDVKYVLDDRTQVVQMWRELGLKCLQVAPGDF
jgi:predicted kinase